MRSLRTIGILTVLATAILLSNSTALLAQIPTTPSPTAPVTPTPTPTPTPKPTKTGKCCACVLAEQGTYSDAEEQRFYNYCQLCLMDQQQNPKAVGCDVVFNTDASSLERDLNVLKSSGECSKEIYVANNQHGPIFDTVAGLISVCVKAFPTCNIELEDHSCQSFRNEKEALVFLTSLQTQLGANASVTVCGNTSSNFTMTCALLSARKRYVVSKYSFSEKMDRCNPEGSVCDPIGDSWQCLGFGKRSITQKCCATVGDGNRFGLWINNANCQGMKECPERCPKKYGIAVHKMQCISPTKMRSLSCAELTAGGYVCDDFTQQCGIYEVCKDGRCVPESGPQDKPSSAVKLSPLKPERSSTEARSKTLGSLTPINGAPHHYSGTSATLSLAFTPRLFFGTSHTAQFAGVNGTRGVVLLSLDPVSTMAMLGLTAGDVIHFVNDKLIESEADITNALSQSRKQTFITFSRSAPPEETGKNILLPKPDRWSWIVTIHSQESGPSMEE